MEALNVLTERLALSSEPAQRLSNTSTSLNGGAGLFGSDDSCTSPTRTAPEKENVPSEISPGPLGSPFKVCTAPRTPTGTRHSVRSSSFDDPNRAFNRRQEAAGWVQRLTGQTLDPSTDLSIRRQLRNGVLLCRILHELKPGTIPQIVLAKAPQAGMAPREATDEFANAFVAAMRTLRIPTSVVPMMADMHDDSEADNTRLVDCLLFLKGSEEARRWDRLQKLQQAESIAEPLTPQQLAQTALTPFQDEAVETPDPVNAMLMRHCSRITSRSAADSLASPVETANAIACMVKQCTAQLRATPPQFRVDESAADSPASSTMERMSTAQLMAQLGPFLGSGITTVTQRYESMIQDKDAELKRAARALESKEKALAEAQQHLQELQRRPPPPPSQAVTRAAGVSAAVAEELAQLRESEADARAELAEALEMAQQAEAAGADSRAMCHAIEAECKNLRLQVCELEEVAGKYADAVAENAALYNEVQDLKGSIRVFCRVRPHGATGDTSPPCTSVGTDGQLALNVRKQQKVFKYDHIYDGNATQSQVYEDTKPLVRSVLDGYNVCIFAYGQTGSGKTHTMSGSNVEQLEGRGINYRALDDLFAINAQRQGEVEYSVRVQLLEIYNEQLRDLLVDTPQRLEIRSTAASGLNVPDATQVAVSCTRDVLEVMARGGANRAVAETKMNERSSRSHSVLSIIVDGRSSLSNLNTHGCLHLIDLAGSERVGRSEATGDRLVEARHINRSLSALGSVMAALAAKASHVPYRDSKLTALLQDSLSGNAKAMMFIHVSPEASSAGESLSTLAFGSRVSEITLGRASRNCNSTAILDARQAAQQCISIKPATASLLLPATWSLTSFWKCCSYLRPSSMTHAIAL